MQRLAADEHPRAGRVLRERVAAGSQQATRGSVDRLGLSVDGDPNAVGSGVVRSVPSSVVAVASRPAVSREAGVQAFDSWGRLCLR